MVALRMKRSASCTKSAALKAAASSAAAFTPTRTRASTPRLRKSGNRSAEEFCLILVTISSCLHSHSNSAGMAKKKLWSGRFTKAVDPKVKAFPASVAFDQRLAPYDIRGSLAHARMLGGQGIVAKRDVAAIERGLA